MKIETRKLSRLEPWMHLAANCLGDNNELKLDFLFFFFYFDTKSNFAIYHSLPWGPKLTFRSKNINRTRATKQYCG